MSSENINPCIECGKQIDSIKSLESNLFVIECENTQDCIKIAGRSEDDVVKTWNKWNPIQKNNKLSIIKESNWLKSAVAQISLDIGVHPNDISKCVKAVINGIDTDMTMVDFEIYTKGAASVWLR